MIGKTLLPEGLSTRPATEADFVSIYEITRAYELTYDGKAETTLEDIRQMHLAPGVSLAKDSCLTFDQTGQLVGYMLLRHVQYAKFTLLLRVQEGYPDPRLGEYLLELAETWARERMVQAKSGVRVILTSLLPSTDAVGRHRYEHAGLREVRRYWEMEMEMREAPPVPIWPEGIAVRPYVPGRDERLAYELVEIAFQDIWGITPLCFEEFRHRTVERPTFDPSLWFLAYQDAQAVGAALCRNEEEFGWIDDLAVQRLARGKGLGTTLLLHSLGEFYRRGQHKVRLDVDSQSLTGAQRIYQRAGMQTVKELVRYEKELRAGEELKIAL